MPGGRGSDRGPHSCSARRRAGASRPRSRRTSAGPRQAPPRSATPPKRRRGGFSHSGEERRTGRGWHCTGYAPGAVKPWAWRERGFAECRVLAAGLTVAECAEIAALKSPNALAWCERRCASASEPAAALPRVVEWSDLAPGDLAWDAGEDLDGCCLVLVRASGRGHWRHADGERSNLGPAISGFGPGAPSIGRTAAAKAVLVAQGVKATASAVREAWEAACYSTTSGAGEAAERLMEEADGLPREIEWSDVSDGSGDLLFDRGRAGGRLARVEAGWRLTWRFEDGTCYHPDRREAGDGRPEGATEARPILVARGVRKSATAIRAVWERSRERVGALIAVGALRAPPRVVDWSDLREGDLALDAGCPTDAGAGAPLLWVGEGRRGQWNGTDGSLGCSASGPGYQAVAPRAILLARSTLGYTHTIRAEWAAVAGAQMDALRAAAQRPGGDALPRLADWADLQPGDLAYDAVGDACAPLLRAERGGRCTWRTARGEIWAATTLPDLVRMSEPIADRAILVARGVPKRASAIRAAYEAARPAVKRLAAALRGE